MKFKLIEDYTDYGYKRNNIEVASDSSDEVPENNDEIIKDNKPLYKTFNITIQGIPQFKVKARDRKEAAAICRKKFKDKKILGIREI